MLLFWIYSLRDNSLGRLVSWFAIYLRTRWNRQVCIWFLISFCDKIIVFVIAVAFVVFNIFVISMLSPLSSSSSLFSIDKFASLTVTYILMWHPVIWDVFHNRQSFVRTHCDSYSFHNGVVVCLTIFVIFPHCLEIITARYIHQLKWNTAKPDHLHMFLNMICLKPPAFPLSMFFPLLWAEWTSVMYAQGNVACLP